MTGKLPGPFEVDYFALRDSYGNEVNLPKITAVTMIISAFSIIKTSCDQNIVRIHLQEGFKFVEFLRCAAVFLPFFLATTIFQLSAISILLTYAGYWILLPAVTISFVLKLVKAHKRYT